MIEKLIEKYTLKQEINKFKRRLKHSRKFPPYIRLDNLNRIQDDLLDLQGDLLEVGRLTDSLNDQIFSLFVKINDEMNICKSIINETAI